MWVQLIDIEVSMSMVQLQVCHGGYRRVCWKDLIILQKRIYRFDQKCLFCIVSTNHMKHYLLSYEVELSSFYDGLWSLLNLSLCCLAETNSVQLCWWCVINDCFFFTDKGAVQTTIVIIPCKVGLNVDTRSIVLVHLDAILLIHVVIWLACIPVCVWHTRPIHPPDVPTLISLCSNPPAAIQLLFWNMFIIVDQSFFEWCPVDHIAG